MRYAELQVTSNFTFLEGASHAEELAVQAAALGHAAIAITDRNSLAGIVRAHVACQGKDIRLIVGCRLDFVTGDSLLCFPEDRAAYGRLCELLTVGRRRAPKGECHLHYADLVHHAEGQIVIGLPPLEMTAASKAFLQRLPQDFPGRAYLALIHFYRGDDAERLHDLNHLATEIGLPVVATNDVLYHVGERHPLQDILTCIRHGCTIDEAGLRLLANAERHLKAPDEMSRLFRRYPEAIANVATIIDRCRFSLSELKYEYPDEVTEPGETPQQTLARLAWKGAEWRYPNGVTENVRKQIQHELDLIQERDYAPYFLTVASIVKFAQEKEILHQGRGSAANSAVCYCLGVTAIDPINTGLLFERFISTARNEPPDIDVDFEHERREEVIQHIYEKYGRDRAGLAATVIRYRSRAAIRDTGKALGLSADTISAISKSIWGWSSKGVTETEIRQAGLDPLDRRIAVTVNLARDLIGFPRHLSQHVGGFVISRGPLSQLVPIENAAMKDRTVVQWDKEDIEALGMMKVDVLGLGMLSCMRRAFEMLNQHYGQELTLASVPQNDAEVYEMLSQADTIGVFQVESRAQMSMLPRLQPRKFYDLVIEVAIVRPGPIQGDMVHPYLRRRSGLEPVDYHKDELKPVLQKTLGVPLFQEQAMRIAMVAAKFTASEADDLRRSMATFKSNGKVEAFEARFIDGMVKNGYSRDFAQRCFNQIKGFGNYGFPESHAASFALLVYISAWIKFHYPDIFAAALLNSQPMGFYAPAQIVGDAAKHGIEIRPVDINHSHWDNTLEPQGNRHAVRLGFRQAKGLSEEVATAIVNHRDIGYPHMAAFQRRASLSNQHLVKLAEADAFRSIGLDRRQALWSVMALEKEPLPLFGSLEPVAPDEDVALPLMPVSQHVIEDYRALALSLKQHPVGFLRSELILRGIKSTEDIDHENAGRKLVVSGLVLVRQRPGSSKGTVFMTLEDEHGIVNLILWPHVFEKYRGIVMGAKMVGCRGKLQREGKKPREVVHVVAEELYDFSSLLDHLQEKVGGKPGNFAGILSHSDYMAHPSDDHREAKKRIPLRSRDFH
ncbi:MAG TPA: error-prone DNA polymerase [Terriglobales bacterium]|nr:error-prone DNA polymerase [Terriglobales bacterium]